MAHKELQLAQDDNGKYRFSGWSPDITSKKIALAEKKGLMPVYYGVQLTLLPNEEQRIKIDKTIGCSRIAANDYYAVKDFMWNEYHHSVSVAAYKREYWPRLKQEYPWLAECEQHSVLSGVSNMDKAFASFFAGRARYPQTVSRKHPNGQRYTTNETNGNIGFADQKHPLIKIPGIGKVRCIIPKGKTVSSIMAGNTKIISITVIHDAIGCYCSLNMETLIDLVNPITVTDVHHIGSMDMGLKHFGIFGDADNTLKEDNPRWIKRSERQLRHAQQILSRKYEAAKRERRNYWESHNYQKAKLRVAKIQRHIANQRKDFHHKLSSIIAKNYDFFVFENLNISGLLKNRHLAKQISSAGWYQFQQFVKYKIERKGGLVIKIDRFFPSSKCCSVCGHKNEDLKLSDRFWYCPQCHTLHDRDVNAKENIRLEGIRILQEQYGIAVLQ